MSQNHIRSLTILFLLKQSHLAFLGTPHWFFSYYPIAHFLSPLPDLLLYLDIKCCNSKNYSLLNMYNISLGDLIHTHVFNYIYTQINHKCLSLAQTCQLFPAEKSSYYVVPLGCLTTLLYKCEFIISLISPKQ